MVAEINPERRLIACVLLKPEILPAVREVVTTGDFEYSDYAELFRGCCLARVVTVGAAVGALATPESRKRALLDMAYAIKEACPRSSDWRTWAYKVVRDSERRKLRAFGERMKHNPDTLEVAEDLLKLCGRIVHRLTEAQKKLWCVHRLTEAQKKLW